MGWWASAQKVGVGPTQCSGWVYGVDTTNTVTTARAPVLLKTSKSMSRQASLMMEGILRKLLHHWILCWRLPRLASGQGAWCSCCLHCLLHCLHVLHCSLHCALQPPAALLAHGQDCFDSSPRPLNTLQAHARNVISYFTICQYVDLHYANTLHNTHGAIFYHKLHNLPIDRRSEENRPWAVNSGLGLPGH